MLLAYAASRKHAIVKSGVVTAGVGVCRECGKEFGASRILDFAWLITCACGNWQIPQPGGLVGAPTRSVRLVPSTGADPSPLVGHAVWVNSPADTAGNVGRLRVIFHLTDYSPYACVMACVVLGLTMTPVVVHTGTGTLIWRRFAPPTSITSINTAWPLAIAQHA